jgi:hypothetical protein
LFCIFSFFFLASTDGLPKVSLKKLDAYQRALLIGSDIDEE